MRLILSALMVLLLAACASQGPVANNAADSQATSTYLRKSATAKETVDVDKQSVGDLTSADTDLWARIRRGFQMPDLQSDLVDMQTTWYTQRPDYVQRMTERSQKYLYHIVEELEARHMPTELALLPFIESAYNPQALSVAKAAGMWQFMPGTGRTYNLKRNMWQDERRDVLASTSAALDYLSRLHDMFGDWYLALAAYNWGEGNVQRAIARNQAAGLPTDYQSLRMPNETRNYVPKLHAVKNIIANPQQYGLTLPDIPNHPYFVTVTTSHDIDVAVAAKLANLSLDEFRSLNPSFSKPVILGATEPQILLPFDNAAAFEKNLKAYNGQLSSWTTYTVSERAPGCDCREDRRRRRYADVGQQDSGRHAPEAGLDDRRAAQRRRRRGHQCGCGGKRRARDGARRARHAQDADSRASQAVDGGACRPLRRVGRSAEGMEPHAPRSGDAGSGDRVARAGRPRGAGRAGSGADRDVGRRRAYRACEPVGRRQVARHEARCREAGGP